MGLYLIAESSWPQLASILYFLEVAVGLGFVIFVHELGHFVVAKACGVKCEKFYVGFDVPIKLGPLRLPQTLGKVQWGETEYGIGIIPLGGYVKMLGQDDNPMRAEEEAERIRLKNDEQTGQEPVNLNADAQNELAESTGETSEQPVAELDPRSYPAKTVFARMCIISAGVIMNLISAVFFAAIAFRMGVPIVPCEIGSVVIGDPAWSANIQQGDKIVGLSEDAEPSENLRFLWDLQQTVGGASLSNPVEMVQLRVRGRDEQEKIVSLLPSDRLGGAIGSIGIRGTTSTTIAQENPTVEHLIGPEISQQIQAGGRIVGVDEVELDRSLANEKGDFPNHEMRQLLYRRRAESVTLVIESVGTEESTGNAIPTRQQVVIPPRPVRSLGMAMEMGPIVALRAGSPAENSGLQVGDRIVTVNDEPVGDPLTLSERISDVSESVKVGVQRVSGKTSEMLSFILAPQGPVTYIPLAGYGGLVSLESLGIAYDVSNVVASVLEDGPAAAAGISPGDVVNGVSFKATNEEKQKATAELFGMRGYEQPILLGDENVGRWTDVVGHMQLMFQDTMVSLNVAGKETEIDLTSIVAPDRFVVERGLRLTPLSRAHRVASWSAAFPLGIRQVKEELQRVYDVLRRLVTGTISIKNLGGPIAIFTVAKSEASQGLPRLLIFLTFLSANLAVLNFLPIPALDGGHMVFLAAEGVTGRPVAEKVQGTLTLVGVALLLALMAFVFYQDISRLFMP